MHNYKVFDKRITGGNVLLLTLVPLPGSENFSYEAGQYVSLGFQSRGRKTPVRSFSIVSAPSETGQLQVAMRVEGNFTQTAAEVTVGSKAYLQGPFGEFTLNPDYDTNVVMLAGGIGVTPFISMIREARNTGSDTRMTLLYSSRSQMEIPFYDELLELERANPNFRVVFFISSGIVTPTNDARIVAGSITGERLQQLMGGQLVGASFFICGPKGFMNYLEATLHELDVPEDWIITESFAQSSKLFNLKRMSLQTKTYAFSGLAVAVAIVGIMLLDLIRYVPQKVAATAATQNTSTTQNADSTATQSTTDDASTSSATTRTTTTSPSTTNTYSQPVSSVS